MLIIEFFEYKTEATALFSEQLITMDPPDPDPPVEPPPVEGKKRDLTSEQRRNIVSMLLLAVKPGDAEMNLQRGASKSCSADTYDVNRFTIRRIWKRALANFRNPDIRAFISSPKKRQKWSTTQVDSRRRSRSYQQPCTSS